ncbi:MAG: molybdopterin oxidoreductase family protein [Chloroflexota bacterium]|nr:molybdopterin oxidoreductase family protein [Chloroflexota bacterium]
MSPITPSPHHPFTLTRTSDFVRGACPHDCPDTCATLVEVRDGRAVGFHGDPDHPITQGWLCAKVRPYLDRVYSPDRLQYPLRRVGAKGSGEWARISWDEAIAEIAGRWQAIIAEHGAAAILPYSFSGTLGLLQGSVAAVRFWQRMGTTDLDGSLCGIAAETAVKMTLGAGWAPDSRDVVESRLIVIWGHNPASTSPHFVPFLREAQRAGAHVVVIDPRRTTTARSADEHLRPRPATDGALALGLMHVLFTEDLHDEAWLRAHSLGWEELRERAMAYPPDRVEAITGIPAENIVALARRYGTTKPSLLKFTDGIQRHGNGGQTCRALACLPAVVGQIGVRGGGLFYSTSGYVKWDGEAFSHRSECPPQPRAFNMNRLGAALTGEVMDPPIQSLYVFSANPVGATPNSSLIVQGMLREDLFTIVHEQFMTDTAQLADIVLPATTQLEQVDLHKPYGQRHLQYNHAAIAPLAEAKSNWDVSRLLATAMGYLEPWLHDEPEDVLREILDASRPKNATLTGITLERLQAEGTVAYSFADTGAVPFADGHFPTPSGKVELRCEAIAALGLDPLPEYEPPAEFVAGLDPDETGNSPLVLITGAAHHFVTTSMANQPALLAKEGTPFIEINPADAAARQIVHGEDVIVSNNRGWCTLRAVITDDVPPGVTVSPKGRWASLSPDRRNVNWVTPDAVADLAGQSTYHSNLIHVRPAATLPDPRLEHAMSAVAD